MKDVFFQIKIWRCQLGDEVTFSTFFDLVVLSAVIFFPPFCQLCSSQLMLCSFVLTISSCVTICFCALRISADRGLRELCSCLSSESLNASRSVRRCGRGLANGSCSKCALSLSPHTGQTKGPEKQPIGKQTEKEEKRRRRRRREEEKEEE